jgi:hypothetical protein
LRAGIDPGWPRNPCPPRADCLLVCPLFLPGGKNNKWQLELGGNENPLQHKGFSPYWAMFAGGLWGGGNSCRHLRCCQRASEALKDAEAMPGWCARTHHFHEA